MTSRRQFLTGLMAASAAGASFTLQSSPTPMGTPQDTVDATKALWLETPATNMTLYSNGHATVPPAKHYETRWVPTTCVFVFMRKGWKDTGRVSRIIRDQPHRWLYRPHPDHQGTDTSG